MTRKNEIVLQEFFCTLACKDTSSIHIERRSSKHDKRYKYIVVMDDDQILREFWPPTKENQKQAEAFMDGYRMAKVVWA